MDWIAFGNKFENGFEVKEKKNKRVLKVAKFIFENLPKVLILFLNWKYIWNNIWIWIGSYLKLVFEIRKGK